MRRLASAVLVAGVLVGSLSGLTPSSASTRAVSAAVTKSETIVRENLSGGVEQVVDTRHVSVTVDQTTNLRGRQEINVSWTGAHPTGGIVADQNAIDAQQEEYPMVLLECRGVASSTAPLAKQISPETCWTQDWSERYQDSFSTAFPPYRLDQFGSAADQQQVVGAPDPLPAACKYLPAPTQHWVPFIAASGEVYDEGPAGCAGEPPESQNVGSSGLPSNETFGVTGLDGDGSAQFDVWTSEENASLGCSTTVPCALVAIPIMGISCNPSIEAENANAPSATQQQADTAACEATGAFNPGQLVVPQDQEDLAVSGSLWWSASNWRNRLVFPLSFGLPDDVCSTVSNNNVVDIYGSELLIQATSQWEPQFCLRQNSFSFVHVQTGEPEARNLLATDQSDAAFTSEPQPGGYGRAVVNAPTAVTGFAISYVIDGANGQPYTHLRLTPLLLAKLLTESYPSELPIQESDPALAHNPLNITLDPQFIALNPGITQGVAASQAASELMALSGDSDVIEALTTYINDNPAARAWLNGAPDPYGMVVNPAYRGIKLPVDVWPLLSTFEPTSYYQSDVNNCLYNSPVPYLPLVAAPLATLEDISESLQFADANSTTVCDQIDGTTLGEKLVAQGPQTVGFRFLIGITPLADDARFGLRAAALETTPGHFVVPTNSSLRAAAALLTPDDTTDTWPIPYATFASAKGRNAYPGTMVVYTAVPTSGLNAQTASDLSQFLTFVGGKGQTPGEGVGQLPPGYLPMTAANHLGALAAYTVGVAQDVAAQNGYVPEVTSTQYTPVVTPTTTTTTTVPPTTTTTVVAFGATPALRVADVGPTLFGVLGGATFLGVVAVALPRRRRRRDA